MAKKGKTTMQKVIDWLGTGLAENAAKKLGGRSKKVEAELRKAVEGNMRRSKKKGN